MGPMHHSHPMVHSTRMDQIHHSGRLHPISPMDPMNRMDHSGHSNHLNH